MDKKTLNKNAFFCFAEASFSPVGDNDENEAGKFEGVAYSGDPIKNHWYWGTVIFDLSTTSVPEKIPVLIEHARGSRAGYASITNDGSSLKASGTLIKNEHGSAVAFDGRAGFPWQMSVHIEPSSVEELQAGSRAVVNGRSVVGPANIFRNSLIREVSFTPVGADPGTTVLTMSESSGNQESKMDLNEALKKIGEMEEMITGMKASASDAEARAKAATEALEEQKRIAREEEVKGLFSEIGREYTKEAANTYLKMDTETFSAVSKDLLAGKKKSPPVPNEEELTNDFTSGREYEFSSEQKKAAIDIMARAINPSFGAN